MFLFFWIFATLDEKRCPHTTEFPLRLPENRKRNTTMVPEAGRASDLVQFKTLKKKFLRYRGRPVTPSQLSCRGERGQQVVLRAITTPVCLSVLYGVL